MVFLPAAVCVWLLFLGCWPFLVLFIDVERLLDERGANRVREAVDEAGTAAVEGFPRFKPAHIARAFGGQVQH